MDDFGNIKDQLSNLEAENNRLEKYFLAQARDNADQGMANLMNQVNGLEREKSTMTFELNEKTKRIEGLRDQSLGPKPVPWFIT